MKMPGVSLQQLSSQPDLSYFQLAWLDDEGQMEEYLSTVATSKYWLSINFHHHQLHKQDKPHAHTGFLLSAFQLFVLWLETNTDPTVSTQNHTF